MNSRDYVYLVIGYTGDEYYHEERVIIASLSSAAAVRFVDSLKAHATAADYVSLGIWDKRFDFSLWTHSTPEELTRMCRSMNPRYEVDRVELLNTETP